MPICHFAHLRDADEVLLKVTEQRGHVTEYKIRQHRMISDANSQNA